MYALLFESDGILARVAVPERDNVTGTFYRGHVINALINHYITKKTQGPGCARSNNPMIKHLRTGQLWFKII
jgi:hypothetical protein